VEPTTDEVIEIHRQQIEAHGGSLGVRDAGLLESALAQPRMSFGGQFVHADLAEMAAAYLYHLAKNHPFIDGNKRVAALSAVVFLDVNEIDIDVDPDEYYDLAYAIASGTADKAAAAEFFRRHMPPTQS
jgi:death-on-curing protein